MIAAFLPAFNEEASIGAVILKAQKYVDKVIVVNDGSLDKTAEVSESAGALVVTHKKNGGYGATLKTCFEVARKINVDAMVILDGDGQHDPDEIPNVLVPVLSGAAHVVVGSRFVKGQQKIPPLRRIGMSILNLATRLIGPQILDSQSGFRAYSRIAIFAIEPAEKGMGAGSEILIQAHENRLKIAEVPIKCSYEVGRRSFWSMLSHGLTVLLFLLRCSVHWDQ